MRSRLREAEAAQARWHEERARVPDDAPALAPRVGELAHRFFVDDSAGAVADERRAHGDLVPIREQGAWAGWLSARWRAEYPPSITFRVLHRQSPEMRKVIAGWEGLSAAEYDAELRRTRTADVCWYNPHRPHCHKDWIAEALAWVAARVVTRYILLVDDDGV
eukprot:gene16726-5215_t